MCQIANATIVTQVVSEKVQANLPFTAFDITRESKMRGATEFHGAMKGEVHNQWDDLRNNSNYTRTLIPTPTGDAWLYHPNGYDIQSYISEINGGTPVNSMSTVAPAVTPVTTVGAAVKTQTTDIHGRLPIYGDMLKQIGALPGQDVDVFISSNGKDSTMEIHRVGSAPAWSTSPKCTYEVNSDGRIRIGPRFINEMIPSAGFIFDISVNGNTIVIENHS